MNLNVSEIFYSIQGEGMYAGKPSVFIRLAGCNLRCAWCDTPYALENSEAMALDPQTILELLGKNNWITRLDPIKGHAHLVLTGGEPMLYQEGIVDMFHHFENFRDQHDNPFIPFTSIETNGTMPIRHPEIPDFIVSATVSPKLENSGLPEGKRYRPDVLASYLDTFAETFWKFVVFGVEDMKEIVVKYLIELDLRPDTIWLMPAGRTKQEFYSRATQVAELAKEYGFGYSPRLQLDLWEGRKGV